MKYQVIEWITLEKLKERQKMYADTAPLGFCYVSPEHEGLRKYANEIELNEFYEDAIIKDMVENKYIICGDTHQNYAIPVFENGYCILSMRRWGELMSDVYRLRGYIISPNFYLYALCADKIEEKLPYGCEINR